MKKIIELTDEHTLKFAKNHHWEEEVIVDIDGTKGPNPYTYEEWAAKKIEEFISGCINEQTIKETISTDTEKVDFKLKG